MRIESLLSVIQPMTVAGPTEPDIAGIAYDSRQVRPGYLFVAIRGAHDDGTRYIDDAIRRGAVAVVAETAVRPRRDVTMLRVEDARRALAEIACAFHGHPSARLEVIGVTGTNGKTTTTFMIRDILAAAGRRPGLIGTVQYEIGDRCIPASRTTPEAPDLQAMLAQMLKAGCGAAVMEVSSHALEQKRVWGVDFDVGVFTNLTHDHLDYHGTIERYFAAKARLFAGLGRMEKRAAAVLNLDDPWGHQLADMIGGWAQIITYGAHPAASVRAEDIETGAEGSRFVLRSPWGDAEVRLAVLGRFNVSNALAALAAAGARGVPVSTMVAALEQFRGAPGRLERIPCDRGFEVFVDYAHTGDALANVLTTLRAVTRRRLIVVFGCGGDRDRAKRPVMGRVAAELADHVILTSDNPRSEDPRAIIEEILAGMPPGTRREMIPDREEAIARAIELARPGDMVLIAGKGHENYQEFARHVVPFDDREVARRLLSGGG
ncbi:MAG: UDP-N-acetylmuramoyl-L-alanyl-D-glutamate--2,6-diaminopimelate ligase [Kiritimatiellae bacterium]|nr:UDP-N-acetylmuramoyl-L-alanyl-D-glutamate--2,6-diaminopimelate ligase [Kiritimatiellia bacterium]